jgi:hypothetical protein
MIFQVVKVANFSYHTIKKELVELAKTNELEKINSSSTFQGSTKNYVIFFSIEKHDTFIAFDKFYNKNVFSNSIFFPYAHLSKNLASIEDSSALYELISSKIRDTTNILAPFYHHKPYSLKTEDQPYIQFFSIDSEKEEAQNNENTNERVKNCHYLDGLRNDSPTLKGYYTKDNLALWIEDQIKAIYSNKLLASFPMIKPIKTPLINLLHEKTAKKYLSLFPARQYIMEDNGKKYFFRIATCHGMLKHISKLKPPFPYGLYESGLCFRKEQEGELSKGSRFSVFEMIDSHLVVPLSQKKDFLKKLNVFLQEFYSIIGLTPKKILRTSNSFSIDLFPWDETVNIDKKNYFSEKIEYQVQNVQLGTVQTDEQNSLTYFNRNDLCIFHFSPGSIQRICSILSKKKLIFNFAPKVLIIKGESLLEQVKMKIKLDQPEYLKKANLKLIVLDTFDKLGGCISKIDFPLFNLVVVGKVSEIEGDVVISKRKKGLNRPLESQPISFNNYISTRYVRYEQ